METKGVLGQRDDTKEGPSRHDSLSSLSNRQALAAEHARVMCRSVATRILHPCREGETAGTVYRCVFGPMRGVLSRVEVDPSLSSI